MLQLKHSLQGKMAAWWSPHSEVGWERTPGLCSAFPVVCRHQQLCHILCGPHFQTVPHVSAGMASAVEATVVTVVRRGEWEGLGRDWLSPPSVLLAFCSLHLCRLYLLGNTVFSCWGGLREGERNGAKERRNNEEKGTHLCNDIK